MANRAGSADLPLHGGHVPPWLGVRMASLGAVMSQAIIHHYGRDELLRRLALALSRATGEAVEATSLLHSCKIDPEQLAGEKAVTLGPLAERSAAQGVTELIILPFFFGPSQALTDYLPERLVEVQASYPRLGIKVARPLVDHQATVDLRLAQLLADNVDILATRLQQALAGEPLLLELPALGAEIT